MPVGCGWQICDPDNEPERCGEDKNLRLPTCDYPCRTDVDCEVQHRCATDVGGFKFCDYVWDLASEVDDGTQLCPANQAMYCRSKTLLQTGGDIMCAPSGGPCCFAGNECVGDCGWEPAPEMCGCTGSYYRPVCPNPPPDVDCSRYIGPCPQECTMDAHCAEGQRCTRRLGNMMFCE